MINSYTKHVWLKILLNNGKIHYYGPRELKILPETIGLGGSAAVYVTKWKNTSTRYVIKKFVDNKEVYLTNLANSHNNIIQFHGITKLDDEIRYSLVLEYADGGTLRNYLRNNTITFKWKNQLRFAKEIASAILWLHDDKGIVHGDLHPNNILVHQNTVKLADFGRSFLKGTDCYNTEVLGVVPYMDPKTFDQKSSYKINEKSDIYSLAVLFWELTSRSSPLNYEKKDRIPLMFDILNGLREKPILNTNVKFIDLYRKCWEYEPDKRPDIHQVNSELNDIDSETINVHIIFDGEISEKLENEDSDLSNCEKDCDLNAIM
ncbi:hypothetical protein RclHR1_06020007 [Rhizophagus clarus]|uniref:Protein kinase domain-containing protein n=1 Tax=Rhizophagus clarus TaxID=94130 RepID=A0A2Z6S8G9_9GLOM|nr:hypothetical protein RclHR1_06020007 [Rhizophagus clarus]